MINFFFLEFTLFEMDVNLKFIEKYNNFFTKTEEETF